MITLHEYKPCLSAYGAPDASCRFAILMLLVTYQYSFTSATSLPLYQGIHGRGSNLCHYIPA